MEQKIRGSGIRKHLRALTAAAVLAASVSLPALATPAAAEDAAMPGYDVGVLSDEGCETVRWVGDDERSLTHALTTEPGAQVVRVVEIVTSEIVDALTQGDLDVFAVPSFCGRSWASDVVSAAVAEFVTGGGIVILGDPGGQLAEPLVSALAADIYGFGWSGYDHCSAVPSFPRAADPMVNVPNVLTPEHLYECDHNTVDPSTLGTGYAVGVAIEAQSDWEPATPHPLVGRAVGPKGAGAVVFDAHHQSHTGPDFHLLFENLIYLAGSLGNARPVVEVSAPAEVAEGDDFTVTLTADMAPVAPAVIGWKLTGTVGAEDVNVEALAGSVTIEAGSSNATIALSAVDDDLVEGDEDLTLELLEGEGYVLGERPSVEVTVVDGDGAPTPTVPVTVPAEEPVKAARLPKAGSSSAGWIGTTGEPRAVDAPLADRNLVAVEPAPNGTGAWGVTGDGAVYTTGSSPYLGGLQDMTINEPIVGLTATPTGLGYWLVGRDGGVFAFGDATFAGSTAGLALHRPVVGIAASCDGQGYYLLESGGGVHAFGTAPFHGSLGGLPLNAPTFTIAPRCDEDDQTVGYWMAGRDGGVFTFGDAPFRGSFGGDHVSDVTALVPDPSGNGYALIRQGTKATHFGR